MCVLISEGPSDRWLLTGLLKRATEFMLQTSCRFAVEVEVLPVLADHQRPEHILDVLGREGHFDLVLYHHDGAPVASAKAKVEEVRDAVLSTRAEPVVPIVPLRETEAWLLADPKALASVLGLALPLVTARLPKRPKDAEAVLDPKALLNEIAWLGVRSGGRDRQRDRRPGMFADLADLIDLERLRKVPSFQRWWSDMANALEELGYKK
ncbi:DUF4276 family protein [Catenulispora acidiphila]|nr:DUF4276 family protein [Catenulispora acidiphila]